MAEHPRLALMHETLAAFQSGDAATLGRFGQRMERSAGTFRVSAEDMPASDPGGIFVDRVRAQRAGKVLDLRLLRARCSRRFSR